MLKKHRCALCDTPFAADEAAFIGERAAICCDCADEVSLEDVLDLTGIPNSRRLLLMLGFCQHTV